MVSEAIIEGCAREDRKAQHALYRALYPSLMSICSRYERDRQNASAMLNLGFLKILQNINKRGKDVPFEPWVRRIMINTVIDEFRRDRNRKEHEGMDMPLEDDHNASTANDHLREIEAEAFERMLQCLPPMSRNVFNLFAIDGYSHAEIAEMLMISTGTSKWHVSNARHMLQKALIAHASHKATVR